LALGTQALLTGAMHEDGLADMADGFWGGRSPQRRLEIMADSRIGTYGVLALVFSVGLRWVALAAVLPVLGPLVLIGLAALSRAGLPSVMTALPHARPGGLSAGVGRPPALTAGLAILVGLGLAGVTCGAATWALFPAMALAAFGIAALARARIGGQTGDVLGATQQISEIAGLLVLAALI
ncbi:MAG: adenosylcobinamide-GDP ribazoletransferase, partial [Rhodobacteraceae bacterium]